MEIMPQTTHWITKDWDDPEVVAKDKELRKLKIENIALQRQLKLLGAKVNEMLYKHKLESPKKVVKVLSEDKEAEWLRKTVNKLEKEVKELQEKLKWNTSCERIVELETKLEDRKNDFEIIQKKLHSKNERIKQQERQIRYYQSESLKQILIKIEYERMAKDVYHEKSRAKQLEHKFESNAQCARQKQRKLQELSTELSQLNCRPHKKSESIAHNKSLDFSLNKQMMVLREKANELRRVYEGEIKRNARAKMELKKEIEEIKRALRVHTRESSIASSKKSLANKSHKRIYSIANLNKRGEDIKKANKIAMKERILSKAKIDSRSFVTQPIT
eukprot:TRINITY_DN3140_c0_g1_i2.p1 TRINITY_DN3140_c0_g1~~TRINITY_DN3140_c0_g1_i2.p1  ORF type:complete len:331 (+),score=115.81 TRINITY_DN3140_c0_g1_i2:112-1104(+)